MSPRTDKQFADIREKTRATILACALELFATRGFHGTSIDAIAKKAGISKGLAYHYFGSKQELLETVIDEGMHIIEGMIELSEEIEDPFQQIVVLIERIFGFKDEDEHFWRLYISLLLQPDILEDFQGKFSTFFEGITQYFENLFRSAGVKEPRMEAMLLVALFDGIGLHYMINKPDYPIDKIKNLLIRKYSRRHLLGEAD